MHTSRPSSLNTGPMRQTSPKPQEGSRDLIPDTRPALVMVRRCGHGRAMVATAGSPWSGGGGGGGDGSPVGAAREAGE